VDRHGENNHVDLCGTRGLVVFPCCTYVVTATADRSALQSLVFPQRWLNSGAVQHRFERSTGGSTAQRSTAQDSDALCVSSCSTVRQYVAPNDRHACIASHRIGSTQPSSSAGCASARVFVSVVCCLLHVACCLLHAVFYIDLHAATVTRETTCSIQRTMHAVKTDRAFTPSCSLCATVQ
jgi:hypothetical protein